MQRDRRPVISEGLQTLLVGIAIGAVGLGLTLVWLRASWGVARWLLNW